MLKISFFVISFLTMALGAAALADDDLLSNVRTEAQKLWNAPGQAPQTDFRLCTDTSCFDKDCAVDPKDNVAKIRARAASGPFVMPAAAASPAAENKNSTCKGKGVVTLVHGFESSPSAFLAVANHLRAAGYNVVTVLLSGHGATYKGSCEGMTVDNWRKDVTNGVTLATTQFPGCPLIIGGHSTGGALAVDYLQHHQGDTPPTKPVAGLLFDPAVELPWTSEDALKGKLGKTQDKVFSFIGDHFSHANVPSKHDQDAERIPAPSDCATALQQVNHEIRTYGHSNPGITVPTRAMFSNGNGEPDPDTGKVGKTIDSVASRTLLLQGYKGTPAILSKQSQSDVPVLDPSCAHNTIMTETPGQGDCTYGSNAVNPNFKSLMDQSVSFLDKHVGDQQTAPTTPPTGVKSQN